MSHEGQQDAIRVVNASHTRGTVQTILFVTADALANDDYTRFRLLAQLCYPITTIPHAHLPRSGDDHHSFSGADSADAARFLPSTCGGFGRCEINGAYRTM